MKKFLSLVLALVMAMSLVTVSAGAKDFTDSDSISGEDYAEAIDVMSALEIIDGYEGGAFQPQGTLTRGAAAKIIACMMLGKTTAESLGSQAAPFKDVPAGSTFAGYIAYCVEAGIIDGYADGTFRPSNKLTGFAFLKMLLTAMGYDSSVEGFTGTNWTVNVARRAIENGLTDGNDEFVGTDLATREEACLYAVNTIKATLVEYEYKGSSVTINGVEISQGASAPKVVTSVNAAQATSIDSTPYATGATGQQVTYTVEFGEKYMPKLSLKGDTDDFARPVHVWDYKGVKVGTYEDTADLEYNKKVASDTIYDELGLTSKVDATVYVDGVKQDKAFTIENNNTSKTGDTGILTQVWKGGYFNAAGVWVTTVEITEMHYYVGDVVSKTPASKNKDAYVTITGRGETATNGRSGAYTTEDFAVDDVVIYNYSESAKAIRYVAIPETATGTLTSFTTADSATVGGTKYDYSCTVANEAAQASINTDVTVVLDPFGYAIDIDGKTDDSYAVVLAYHKGLHYEATLLFADGTVKDVVLNGAYAGGTIGGNDFVGDIVSYVIKSSDRYELTQKANTTPQTVQIKNGYYTFETNLPVNGNKNAFTGAGAPNYANGKTIFLVKTQDANGNAIYNAYEGIKNMPSVNVYDTTSTVTVFAKNGAAAPATVVYVDATAKNSSVLNPASDVIFVVGEDPAKNETYTSGIGTYYLYDAVVNGTLKEGDEGVKASAAYVGKDAYGLYDGVSYDANGVATLYKSDNVIEGTGAYKQANDVLGTMLSGGSFKYYGVAESCYVVIVNEEGDIQTGLTAGSVVEDKNDLVFFKLNSSNEIASAYIVKVADSTTNLPNVDAANYDINVTNPSAVTVKYYTGAASDALTILQQIQAKLATMGFTSFNVTYNAGSYTVNATNGSITIPYIWNGTATECVKVSVDGTSMLVDKTAKLNAVVGNSNYAKGTAKDGTPIAWDTANNITVADGAAYEVNYTKLTITPAVTDADSNAADFTAALTSKEAQAYVKTGADAAVDVDVTITTAATNAAVNFTADHGTVTGSIESGIEAGQVVTVTLNLKAADVTGATLVVALTANEI